MDFSTTRVIGSLGDPGKWVAQYYDRSMQLWFDIGDAKATKQEAEEHLKLEWLRNAADEHLEYLKDFDPRQQSEVPAGTPFCVVILENMTGPDGVGFVPSVVYENVSGHFSLSGKNGARPWVWGPSYDAAVQQATEFNAEIGVSPTRAHEIIASSFRMQHRQGKL